MTTRVLIIFGETTADEIRTAAGRISQAAWDRIEKIYVDGSDPDRSLRSAAEQFPGAEFIVGIADVTLRRQAAEGAERVGLVPRTVIDPGASVDPSARLEPGCFVAANAVVSCRAHLKPHVLVHFNATVGHDAQVGPHSVILPGARLSGKVQLGAGVLVGSNAFVFQNVTIGEQAKIDALTYVRDDVPAFRVVSGRRG